MISRALLWRRPRRAWSQARCFLQATARSVATPLLRKDMKGLSDRNGSYHAGREFAMHFAALAAITVSCKNISFLLSMDEQRAFGLERAELRGVAEPAPGVNLRSRRRIA